MAKISVELYSGFCLSYFHLGLEMFSTITKPNANIRSLRAFYGRVAEFRDVGGFEILDILGELI